MSCVIVGSLLLLGGLRRYTGCVIVGLPLLLWHLLLSDPSMVTRGDRAAVAVTHCAATQHLLRAQLVLGDPSQGHVSWERLPMFVMAGSPSLWFVIVGSTQ